MFVIKVVITTGLVSWGRRYGFDNNDKANGLAHAAGFVYLVGESDSTGWTSAKTDMIFMKIDEATGIS